MANEDKTRQMDQTNGASGNEQVLAAIKALDAKVDGLDGRLTSVEEIILARLNDTRPLEQQMMSRLDELITGQAAVREELATLRKDYERFREETNNNFRKMRKVQELLNEDHMQIRAEHSLLESRVEKLEDRAA